MIITQTPLRVSLVGGGTDIKGFYSLYDGEVISAAINKYIYVIVKRRFDKQIRLGYSKTELVEDRSQLKHLLIREALEETGITGGIEITTLSDAPVSGTGLASSSAVTVGVLNALYYYQFNQKPPRVLAERAVEIEVERLKKPIGKQDQYIVAFGGLCWIKFHKNEDVSVMRLQLSKHARHLLQSYLMLVYTNIGRDTDKILVDLVQNIRVRVKYLHEVKSLVSAMEFALIRGNMKLVGELLSKNWELKKFYSKDVSNDTLELIYKCAMDNGAYGGKVLGAGGGGFFLFCCPPEKQEQVKRALNLPDLYFSIAESGSRVILNLGD